MREGRFTASDARSASMKEESSSADVRHPAARSCWCARPLAILQSGQAARFTLDSAFTHVRGRGGRTPLQQLILDRTAHPYCVPVVDAFVVLSGSRQPAVWAGAWNVNGSGIMHRAMASFNSTKRELLASRSLYSELGVRSVHLEVIPREDLVRTMRDLEPRVAALGAAAVATTPLQWWRAAQTTIPGWDARWTPHSQMLYLRHLVYARARDTQVPYAHFLYCREDNAFLEPIAQLAELAHLVRMCKGIHRSAGSRARPLSHAVPTQAAPLADASTMRSTSRGTVAVDEQCGWGSWSDKIYLADTMGAQALFAPTLDLHIARMASWVQLAMLPPNASHRLRPLPNEYGVAALDPMQTEYFVQAALMAQSVNVHRVAFHRTDLRRSHDHANGVCVPDLYWQCRRGLHMPKGLTRCRDRWSR